jgi:hypothetical protein
MCYSNMTRTVRFIKIFIVIILTKSVAVKEFISLLFSNRSEHKVTYKLQMLYIKF